MFIPEIAGQTARDRTPQALGLGAALGAFAVGMIALASAMEDLITDLTASLPDAYTGLLGSSGGNYVVSSSFGLIMPIAICVIGISGGTRAFAGEENRRTADLLLTQPVTRRDVVVSKAAVLVGNVALASALFAAGAAIGAALVDIAGVTPSLMLAGAVHVGFLGLMFAMFALAVANLTGSATVGTGTAAGVAVLSNLAAGLLPLSQTTAWGAKLSPWYYFNGSDPSTNGVDVGHLAVMAALAAGAFAVAVVAVDRRDVGSYRSGLDITGLGELTRPRVSTIFVKSLSERTTLLAVASSALISMAFVCGLMYGGLADTLVDFSDELPDALSGLIGTSEIGTPAGWVQAEMLSMVAPFVMVGIGIVMGVGAIAGEADRHTLAMLVAGPLRRRTIIVDKSAAIVVGLVLVGTVGAVALVIGSAVGGLGLPIDNIVGALAHVTLLGVFFGMVGLAVGAATAKTVALTAATALAFVAYLADWLLGISERTDQFARLSPWFYASDAEALVHGADLTHLGALAALSAIALAVAVRLFDQREIAA